MKVSNSAIGQTFLQAENLAGNLNDKPAALNDDKALQQLTFDSNQGVFAKKSAGDSIAAFNRQRFFAAQENETVQNASGENAEINGITENTRFKVAVGEPEPPERKRPESRENSLLAINKDDSALGLPTFRVPVTQGEALQAGFEAMANKAGLTDDAKQSFVNERLRANTVGGNLLDQTKPIDLGTIKINNKNNDNKKFTDEEWQKVQGGTIDITPTTADIEALKEYKESGDARAGSQAAETLLRAIKSGERSLADKALSDVKAQAGNENFQRGFVEELGADNFVKLEKTFANNQTGGADVLRESLSVASKSNLFPVEVQREIVQKSNMDALARLTGNESSSMSKEFLVEAGTRAVTKEVGWRTVVGPNMPGPSVRINKIENGTKDLLQHIAQNEEASLELLQDAEFVKNATILENSEKGEGSITQIIKSGMSAEMREKDSGKVSNALRVLAEILKQPEEIEGIKNGGLPITKNNVVSEKMAVALADVYINNTASFAEAAGHIDSRDDRFDGTDVRKFFAAIQPYQSTKDPKTGQTLGDRISAATAVEYMKSLEKAALAGNASEAGNAGNLAGALIDANSRAKTEAAKEADEQQEKLAQYIAIAGEVTTFYSAKGIGVDEIVSDVLGKAVAAEAGAGFKGKNVDRADAENDAAYNRQQSTNGLAVLSAFERAANNTVSNGQATAEQKAQAKLLLQDLRTYNDALPSGEKILEANGRLINRKEANNAQLDHMENILNNRMHVSVKRSKELEEATNRLSKTMRPTFAELRDATNSQIRR